MFRSIRFDKFAAVTLLSLGTLVSVAYASHSWGGYHWARTANPFTLKLGDNVSPVWDGHLAVASSDWSESTVLDTAIVSGANLKNCRPVKGRVEVCNQEYGNNGWLGVAQIWINRSGHITQGAVKLNDTYFSTAPYNTPAWRQFVTCQEIGHTFGLDHQDENFNNANLGTCMDYTSDPSSNQHPNQHDYDQLVAIYTHLDGATTVGQTTSGHGSQTGVDRVNGQEIAEWGKSIRTSSDGKPSLFERDLGNGNKVFTFVIWTDQDTAE